MTSLGWLDIHGHFRPPFKNHDERKAAAKAFHELCFLMPEDWSWNVDESLAYMDKAGVQMQMLSYLPFNIQALKESNDFAAAQVRKHPTRLGLLCALPTEDPEACLSEIKRGRTELHADGYAVSAIRKDVYLSDPSLDPVWAKLDSLGATVFSHPNAYAPAKDGRPTPLIEVAFETTRVIVDMLYRGIFKKYPNIKFVFSHCGGATPILAGRLELLGAEVWVPNPDGISRDDIKKQLASLYVDTAATAESGMQPAVKMVGPEHVIYGADCGVPCSTHDTMEENRLAVVRIEKELGLQKASIGANGWRLFPAAAKRVQAGGMNGSA
ncbi:hypothetical protein M409DRAFT_30615 [Zasmidium cellare ATCC 36951]|uniref:6-methylsalicylate decarboxylase n=1 Tax=Zasmidium cellare ATCC 36951 TaxID=1080233 RepID=A0A6A6BY95_ZASCE|nr:uncharacterized protein M409DRAFT_30615 [Zasmidium cellare ATCC 36951]KAF2158910.1 hypothetical protein M409DRAFT_30615 [Zasmidium cellare ATCC 36951]